MVLVLDKKPLEGVWWKWGVGLSGVQLLLWLLAGYRINPGLNVLQLITRTYIVYGAFIAAAFLPFVFGRLGLRRLMWACLVGWMLAGTGYFLLVLFEPTRRIALLPFISYLQLYSSAASIGLVLELGRIIWIKVFEE